ncbi:pyridoxal phosphate-dependent aminotransferase [Achromobacter sp. Bel]|uniref:pyridoxal phosphate-dependent aminotransferase n=1 Tax=Achromobacter sp. Bel TaxID=2727415 RepID=UPI00145D1367|nr:pyridoxal phosphate-dependent aminotransferase [Achromobacter sp. Bel]NMK44701.1 pyridoxal phosphate-dependent aminotransferase [Achromobacter sp. Bel]
MQTAARLQRIKPSPSSMAGQHARMLRAQGRDIVGLTSGEPDFDTPAHIREAAYRAMNDGHTRYTDVGGTAALREAVRAKFARENGLDYGLDEIIVSTGAKQIIFNAIMATVDTGDEVIVPAPYWVSYPDITLLANGTPVIVDTRAENGFRLQAEELERAITPKTRWLILNGPNNPSGANFTQADLRALAEVLRKHPHVWILTDDIYEHLLYDGRRFYTLAQVAPDLKDRTLTLNGVSKAYAMTGWRIGYAGAPAALIKAMTKLQSQSTSNPSSVSQAAALAALTGPQDFVTQSRERFQARRDRIVQALNAIDGIDCASPEGAFYVFPKCADLYGLTLPDGSKLQNSEQWVLHLLNAQNLAVLQGSAYGVDTHFRISFAASDAVLEEGCRRIAQARAQLA